MDSRCPVPRKQLPACLALLLLAVLTGCTSEAQIDSHRRPTEMNRFDWLASNSAPRGTPMFLVGGAFHYHGGGSLYVPTAELHSGWGEEVSLHVVGEDLKPLPDRVELTYYSYLEDTFYQGSFALPYEQIVEHFRAGFRSFHPQRERETYRSIVAGVAPGGAVAVWLSGSERQVEVFFGRAEPVELEWEAAMGFPETEREEARVETLMQAAQHDSLVAPYMQQVPSAGPWERYRKPFRWRPAFEGIGRPELLEKMRFFNGERDYMTLPAEGPAEWVERPLPSGYTFVDRQANRSYNLSFEEQETFSAFERLGGASQPVELLFLAREHEGSTRYHVVARRGEEAVELTRVKLEIHRAR